MKIDRNYECNAMSSIKVRGLLGCLSHQYESLCEIFLNIGWFLLGPGISCTRQDHHQTPVLEDMIKRNFQLGLSSINSNTVWIKSSLEYSLFYVKVNIAIPNRTLLIHHNISFSSNTKLTLVLNFLVHPADFEQWHISKHWA